MGVFTAGVSRTGVFVDGQMRTGVWVAGVNRLDAPPDNRPRNTYGDWSNSGGTFNQQTTATNVDGAFQLINTAATVEFQNEAQLRTTTTVVTASQNQVRTCTASGGCDGPFTRTVTVEVSRSVTTSFVNTRATTTPNPGYEEPFTQFDAQVFVTCSVDRITGVVTVSADGRLLADDEGEPIVLTVELAPGQQSVYPLIPFGSPSITRSIEVLVNGEIPAGFQNAGTFIQAPGIAVTCTTIQTQAPQAPLVADANIQWRNAFGRQRQVARDGDTISLIGSSLNAQYTISPRRAVPPGVTVTGTGTFDVIDTPTIHRVVASDATRSSTITFTVDRESGGFNEF